MKKEIQGQTEFGIRFSDHDTWIEPDLFFHELTTDDGRTLDRCAGHVAPDAAPSGDELL